MSKLFSGSICVTDLIENAKKQHSAFMKSQNNGKVYCNVLVWENDEADKYGNTHSFQLNSAKDKRETEGKVYIGNAKPLESKPPTDSDLGGSDWDAGVPTKEKSGSNESQPKDDLPF